jgi:hypothetical protein
MNRRKLAELTSGVGALVLGVGLGALFPHWFGSIAGLIVFAGLSLHAFGMWDKHRLEAGSEADDSQWAVALYWVCWLLLAVVLALLLFSNRTSGNRNGAGASGPREPALTRYALT